MTAPTEQPVTGSDPSAPKRPANADLERTFMIATMAIVAFLALWTIRNVVIQPFDNFATQQVCLWHSGEIDKTVESYERSNRVGLMNRRDASCTFAAQPQADEAVGASETILIGDEAGEIEPGPFYTLAKALGLGLQLVLTYGVVRAAMRAISYFRRGVDPGEWVLVVVLAMLALVALLMARNALVNPLDSFVTQQVCRSYGEEIDQELIDSERSNTFTLRTETEGFCQYGPGLEEQPAVRLTIEETTPSALYYVSKVAGVFLQLGAASIVLRFLVDPVFDVYRSIRRKVKSS